MLFPSRQSKGGHLYSAMSIKRGFISVPHEGWGNVPLDTLIANLFEHSYEHWFMHKHHLKWRFTTYFIRAGFFLTTGSSIGYNQYVGGLGSAGEQQPHSHSSQAATAKRPQPSGHSHAATAAKQAASMTL